MLFLDLLITSMLKEKQIQKVQKHGSQCALPQFYFYLFILRERQSFIFKRFLFSLFTKFLSFQQSSPKAEIKLHEHEHWGILQHTHYDPWKAICASFAWHAFFCWWMYRALVCSPMGFELEDFPIDFESFPVGVSPERYTSKVCDCINPDGTMIKHDTMSYLITEGCLT